MRERERWGRGEERERETVRVCVCKSEREGGAEKERVRMGDVCVCVSVRACVCVCGWNELELCTTLAYPHISSFCAMPVLYTSTHILKPFEDSELTGLKVDIAQILSRVPEKW